MQVEFRVRVSDFRNAVQQLVTLREKDMPLDMADVLVSESVATLRTIGISADLAVRGIQPGTARLPIRMLDKISRVAKTLKGRETSVWLAEGFVKIGSWQTHDSEITLGTVPDASFDLPINASFLDTLAMATVLTPAGIEKQGLEKRVAKAQRAKEDALDRATRALEPLAVDRDRIAEMVEEHIAAAGQRLQSVLLK